MMKGHTKEALQIKTREAILAPSQLIMQALVIGKSALNDSVTTRDVVTTRRCHPFTT